MPPLSRQQEQQIVDGLVSLDWMSNWDRKSSQLISEQLGCTMREAMEVLGYLHLSRKLIQPKFPRGEELRPGVPAPRSRWKWERQSK
jgi:hypothetical protein